MGLEDLIGAKAGSLLKDITAGKAGSAASDRAEAFKKICALIPNKVDNATVVNVLDLMRKQQKAVKKDYSVHMKKNRRLFRSMPLSSQKTRALWKTRTAIPIWLTAMLPCSIPAVRYSPPITRSTAFWENSP